MRSASGFRLLGVVLVLAIAGAACSGGVSGEASSSGGTGSVSGGTNHKAVQGPEKLSLSDSGSDSTVVGPAVSSDLPAVQPKVIKTADVSVGVSSNDFSRAFADARDVADRFGGYNLESSVSGSGRDFASVRFRVPSDSFSSALNALEDLSGMGDVRSERISGQDVTSEFIDLKARLTNLTSQRRVLLRLMDRAHSIADSIRVEDQLRQVQLQIEEIRGRLRYLDNETTYSTIAASITAGVPAPTHPGVLQRAWTTMTAVATAIVSALVIGGATLIPIAVLLVLAFVAFRLIWPRVSSIREM